MSACKCCERYAPRHIDMKTGKPGETVSPCQGTAAISEARKWAKMWKARALRAGWGKKLTAGGKKAADGIAQVFVDAESKVHTPELWRCEGCRGTFPTKELDDGNRCKDCREEKEEDRAVAALWDVGANSRRAIERIASEMDERGDVSTARRLRSIASPLLEMVEEVNPPAIPATPPPRGQPEDKTKTGQALEDLGGILEDVGATITARVVATGELCRCERIDGARRMPGAECSHCKGLTSGIRTIRSARDVTLEEARELAKDWDADNSPPRDIDPDGDLYVFCSVQSAEEWFGAGSDVAKEVAKRFRLKPWHTKVVLRAKAPAVAIARCVGGHNVAVDSPMHEQMLERGCFHCGAYMEDLPLIEALKVDDGEALVF